MCFSYLQRPIQLRQATQATGIKSGSQCAKDEPRQNSPNGPLNNPMDRRTVQWTAKATQSNGPQITMAGSKESNKGCSTVEWTAKAEGAKV